MVSVSLKARLALGLPTPLTTPVSTLVSVIGRVSRSFLTHPHSRSTTTNINSSRPQGCSTSPQCSAGTLLTTTIRCGLAASGDVQYQSLCCPLNATPDPKFCTWRAGSSDGKDGFCTPGCNSGETSFASGSWAVIDGGNVHCFIGTASYCCETVETGSGLCGWNPICTTLSAEGQPTDSNACPEGRDFVTYAKSGNGQYCDGAEGNPQTCESTSEV